MFTVATVGYTEVYERTRAAEIFTIVLILLGVGVVLYNLGVIVEGFTRGTHREYIGRRRIDRTIDQMHGATGRCGYGRVGKAAVGHLLDTGSPGGGGQHDPAGLIGMPVRMCWGRPVIAACSWLPGSSAPGR